MDCYQIPGLKAGVSSRRDEQKLNVSRAYTLNVSIEMFDARKPT
jgi:hypothetical protein